MSASVRRIESLVPARARAFGGKARNLAALARAGLPVPAAFAVSSEVANEVLRSILAPKDRPEALLTARTSELTPERLAPLHAAVLGAPLSRSIEWSLVSAFEALRAEGATSVAVRSSSVREDDEARSAAGMHDTVLGAASPEAMLAAVRRVWASVLTPRAMAYLRAVGATEDVGVGVVLQTMVPAEVAGVLFTANPVSGDPAEMIVNAAYGLGSLVVDGGVSPDTWRMDKATGFVRDHVRGDKALSARVAPDGEVVVEPVPPEARGRACLPPPIIERLVALGRRVESSLGAARDVEWALAKDTLYVLQARPITAIAQRGAAPARSGRTVNRSRIVWSNVNVGEALPGVATPLTWSVLSGFSDRGFRRAFAALGCTVPKDAELVGNFRGRIYLNMSEFLGIASAVPGLSPRVILSLGGGGEVDRLERDAERRGRGAFLVRLPVTAARFAKENFRLTDRVLRWEKAFLADKRRVEGIDMRILSATAVHRVLGEIERLLDQSGEVMLNVYGNLLGTMVALRTLIHTVAPARADDLLRELLTGLTDVDSAAPGLALATIAEAARHEPQTRALLTSRPPGSVTPAELPPGRTAELFASFLAQWGDRGAREAEIAEPRWREDPSLPLAVVRMHLLAGRADASPLAVADRQRALREAAEGELAARVPFVARPAARALLDLSRHFLRLRERLRAHVVSVLGMFRRVALDTSRRLRAMEPGCGEEGAFFLTLEELHAVLSADVGSVASLIRTRRIQHERDRSLPAPPDTFVGQPPAIDDGPLDAVLLRGLGASAGRRVGTARVLFDPSELAALVPGEILVTPQCDVGFSPVFLVAAGLVADLGGPLSHASIVARELGLPAVVNVKHASRTIKTGDVIEVDGDEGTVRVLERAAP